MYLYLQICRFKVWFSFITARLIILCGVREVRDVSASARGLYALTLNCWSVAQLSWIWRIFSKKLWTDNWDRSWFSRKVMICSSPIPQILSWKTVKVTVTTLLSTTCFVVLAFNFLCASFFFLTAVIVFGWSVFCSELIVVKYISR